MNWAAFIGLPFLELSRTVSTAQFFFLQVTHFFLAISHCLIRFGLLKFAEVGVRLFGVLEVVATTDPRQPHLT